MRDTPSLIRFAVLAFWIICLPTVVSINTGPSLGATVSKACAGCTTPPNV